MARRKARENRRRMDGGRPSLSLPWQIGALSLLVLAGYWNSINSSFHFDDPAFLTDPYVAGSGFGWGILRAIQTRPLTYLTFHWNYLIGGTNPRDYHLVNLLSHASNAILVLLIGRRHLLPFTAWLAAALFAIHPLQTEAVTYVYQRASLLAAVFALLSFLFYLRESYTWSALAFALSLLSKEETVALPVFLLVYELFQRRRRPPAAYFLAMFALAALAALRLSYAVHMAPKPSIGFQMKAVSSLQYVLTEPRVIWSYLRLFLLPVGLNLDHDVTLSQSLFSPPSTLLAFLGLGAVIVILAWLVWRGNQPAFWALGFLLLLLPSSSVIPLADVMFEHRVYFPLISLVMVAAWLPARLPRRLAQVTAAALLVTLLVGTIVRNRIWQDEKSLWSDVVRKSPRKPRGYGTLALAYFQDDPSYARQLLERALELDPNNPTVHSRLGVLLLFRRDAEGALQSLGRAVALEGENADNWVNLGMAQMMLGKPDEAIQSERHALILNPCNTAARGNLMRWLVKVGRRDEALSASQLPAHCRLIPEEIRELEAARHSLQ